MAIIANPKTLNLDDIQGMVTRGYGKLLETAYFLLKVKQADKAKAWMTSILPKIDTANVQNTNTKTLHLAITANGLAALGMAQENIAAFPVSIS